MTTKQCHNCLLFKPLSEFNKHKVFKDGYSHRCKACHNKQRRDNYQKEESKLHFRQSAQLWADKNLEKIILTRAKSRAKKANLEFNIEIEDIIIPKFCPILNIELLRGKGKMSAASPSLDRLDPSRGYVKNNVAVISYQANVMKNGATKEELLTFAKNIKQYINKCTFA